MPTLVLPPRYTDDANRMWRAAIAAGWEVARLQGWRVPPELAEQDVTLYGEPLFAAVVANALGLALLEPPFDWLTKLPEHYRQRAVALRTLGEARQLDQPAFVKPADDKAFLAKVYEVGSQLPGPDILPGDLPILVAEPVTWEVEFRCFVLDRQVVTMSPYLRLGQLAQQEDGEWFASPDETHAARAIADRLLKDAAIALPPAVVLDVGRIRGRDWAVVEANAAWGSGLYGCDAAAVLPVVRRACVKRTHVTAADRPWIIERQ